MRSSQSGDTLDYGGDPFRWIKAVVALAIAAMICGFIITYGCGGRSMKDIDREYRQWDSSRILLSDTVQVDTVPVPVQSDKVIAPDTPSDSIR